MKSDFHWLKEGAIHMISQEKFKKLEYQYGCGYWNVCWEHACPCAITTENKGYSESIYNGLIEEAQRVADMFAEEDDDYYSEEYNYDDDRLPCGCCACCGCSCEDDYDWDDIFPDKDQEY